MSEFFVALGIITGLAGMSFIPRALAGADLVSNLFWSLPLGILFVLIYYGRILRREAQGTPHIASREDLDAFKRVVSTQMYAASAGALILVTWIAVLLVDLSSHEPTTGALGFLITVALVFTLVSVWLYAPHRHLRNLVVSAPELVPEYQHVCRRWKKAAFPDW